MAHIILLFLWTHLYVIRLMSFFICRPDGLAYIIYRVPPGRVGVSVDGLEVFGLGDVGD